MHGHYPYGSPPPAPRTGISPLTIVLLVVIGVLVLGGGGCLLCIGLAVAVDESSPSPAVSASAPAVPNLVRDGVARDLETKLKSQGIPATSVLCPAQRSGSFTCDLAVGADHANLSVTDTGSGYSFDVPNTAFLDGAKLAQSFQTTIASKVNPNLRVPCFTGTLMKAVGSQFMCDVVSGGAPAGSVVLTVDDAQGNVRMDFTGSPAARPTAAKKGPRVVDFTCPPGKAPGGAVRGGCVCGSEILGTACGAPGNFTDIVETPRGCRFTCN